MKKIFSCLLTLLTLICFVFTGCSNKDESGNNNNKNDENLIYSETYSYSDTHHWRNELNGKGRIDVGEHVNDNGKCVCGKYFDATKFFEFKQVNLDGVQGLGITKYRDLVTTDEATGAVTTEKVYEHLEIPTHYENANGEKMRIIAIDAYVFANSQKNNPDGNFIIKSVKFNEGLLRIGNGAFSGTDIEEVYIPDSVRGGVNNGFSSWPTSGGLYNTFSDCGNLKKAVIGNGVSHIEGYVFSNCNSLSEVVLGSNVVSIRQRAFYEAKALKDIVIPASVVSVPESSIYSEAVNKYVGLCCILPYAENVYMEISKAQYKERSIKKRQRDVANGWPRDLTGIFVHPDNYIGTAFGFVEGWEGMAQLHFANEWRYDENGRPVANNATAY